MSKLDVWESELDAGVCMRLVEWAKTQTPEPGTATPGESRAVTQYIVKGGSSVARVVTKTLNHLAWKYAERHHIDTRGFQQESITVLRYRRHDHYVPHMEWEPGDQRPRKVVCIGQLNYSADFQGGDVTVWSHGPHALTKYIMSRVTGTLIFFPSFMLHEVTEVYGGERWALFGLWTGKEWS